MRLIVKIIIIIIYIIPLFAFSQKRVIDTLFIIVPDSLFINQQIDFSLAQSDDTINVNKINDTSNFLINIIHKDVVKYRAYFLSLLKKANLSQHEKDFRYSTFSRNINYSFRHYNSLSKNDSLLSKKYEKVNIDSILAYTSILDIRKYANDYNCSKTPFSKIRLTKKEYSMFPNFTIDKLLVNLLEMKFFISKSDVVYINVKPIKPNEKNIFYEVRLDNWCNRIANHLEGKAINKFEQ